MGRQYISGEKKNQAMSLNNAAKHGKESIILLDYSISDSIEQIK